jgi:hypothetical protein
MERTVSLDEEGISDLMRLGVVLEGREAERGNDADTVIGFHWLEVDH